jgi:hypothetical protein
MLATKERIANQPIVQNFDEQMAAKILGISYANLKARRLNGEIAAIRIGRRVLYNNAILAEITAAHVQHATA